jgi:hypothetical protein
MVAAYREQSRANSRPVTRKQIGLDQPLDAAEPGKASQNPEGADRRITLADSDGR